MHKFPTVFFESGINNLLDKCDFFDGKEINFIFVT